MSTTPHRQFSVLTEIVRLNIIGAKLYTTILAEGERKKEYLFQKKESFFLRWNAMFLLALRKKMFHLATIRRLG
jgi:hypothetical protein